MRFMRAPRGPSPPPGGARRRTRAGAGWSRRCRGRRSASGSAKRIVRGRPSRKRKVANGLPPSLASRIIGPPGNAGECPPAAPGPGDPFMRINRVEAIAVDIPLAKNFGGSTYAVLKRSTVITRLGTDAGLTSEVYNGDNREHGPERSEERRVGKGGNAE